MVGNHLRDLAHHEFGEAGHPRTDRVARRPEVEVVADPGSVVVDDALSSLGQVIGWSPGRVLPQQPGSATVRSNRYTVWVPFVITRDAAGSLAVHATACVAAPGNLGATTT